MCSRMPAPYVKLLAGPIFGDSNANREQKTLDPCQYIPMPSFPRFSRIASPTLFRTNGRSGARDMIRVSNVHKCYRNVDAVRTLSFDVLPGQILGLVGPNGAGKTTTMRAIAGIIPATTGTIEVAGHDVRAGVRGQGVRGAG